MQQDFKYLKTIEEMGMENAQLRLNKNTILAENLQLKEENEALRKELENLSKGDNKNELESAE